jgi:uncharacterized membrane-anchored protein
MNKVARITATFWIIKICATTLGETAGDLLSMTMDVGYAVSSLILISAFLISLVAQLRSKAFHAGLFWLVILTTSTAGTTISDFMDRTLKLGYANGSLILSVILVLVLGLWRVTEKSLSVSNINSKRAEIFYWMAILVSNTLGTALGDFLADDSGLGFAGGAGVIGGILILLVIAKQFTQLSRVGLFWAAFILTRPFGATLGDLLTKTNEKGGLGFGTVGSSVILAIVMVGLIIYVGRKERRLLSQSERPSPAASN